jgi:hypothetical protein
VWCGGGGGGGGQKHLLNKINHAGRGVLNEQRARVRVRQADKRGRGDGLKAGDAVLVDLLSEEFELGAACLEHVLAAELHVPLFVSLLVS